MSAPVGLGLCLKCRDDSISFTSFTNILESDLRIILNSLSLEEFIRCVCVLEQKIVLQPFLKFFQYF